MKTESGSSASFAWLAALAASGTNSRNLSTIPPNRLPCMQSFQAKPVQGLYKAIPSEEARVFPDTTSFALVQVNRCVRCGCRIEQHRNARDAGCNRLRACVLGLSSIL